MRAVYETNVFGVVRVTHAFLPLLAASDAPVIVMVSSGLGSLAVATDPSRFESARQFLPYPSSKSALNMVTVQYAKAFPAMRINTVDPGYTATDFNRHRGTPDRRGRRGDHRPDGQHRPRRPDRRVLQRRRARALVSSPVSPGRDSYPGSIAGTNSRGSPCVSCR